MANFSYKVEDFKEAKPVNTFAKIALAGPQNSGKTVSAFRIAAGLGGETAMIDSEAKRALKYSASFKFKHFSLEPPFSSENYQAAIEAAVKAGFSNVIVDSMSHEHEGPGGMLEQVEQYLERKTEDIEDAKQREKKREALKMSAFIGPKAARNRLIQFGIQRIPANVILCFRAKEKVLMKKEKWVNETTHKSGEKTVVVNAGLQPIGGEEFWFEMDIVAMLGEGSQGKPDWEQVASRINEFPRGKMTEFLHGVQQFNEDVGRRLKEFNTPVEEGKFTLSTSKASAKYHTPEEWRDQALTIIGKLTTVDQCKAFLSVNNANIFEVAQIDGEASSDVIAAVTKKEDGFRNA